MLLTKNSFLQPTSLPADGESAGTAARGGRTAGPGCVTAGGVAGTGAAVRSLPAEPADGARAVPDG